LLPLSAGPLRGLLIYPSPSIGNFALVEAAQFVSHIRVLCGSDGKLLLGMDRVKDKPVLEAANDHALGIAAAFNLNILNNVNGILGSDLDVRH